MKLELSNWGLYPSKTCNFINPHSYDEIIRAIAQYPQLIARGNGRCYGDASLSKNVVSTLALNKIIFFDEVAGIITCQAGVLLSEILETIVPKGFFLPVSPGTKFITIGGAFASDIHGKNHHIDGVFSDHTQCIKLIDAFGEIQVLSAADDLFAQTAGGMGATGIIVELTIKLKKIATAFIKQTACRASNLQEIFAYFEANAGATYSVAWIDCLAKDEQLGRSVLLLGEHAVADEVKQESLLLHGKPLLNIPFFFPGWVLNHLFVKCFNWIYYHKPSSNAKDKIIHYDDYFYPLDKINNWNKIYSKKGFLQYQLVLPKVNAYEGLKKILTILSTHQLGSFLAVLKLFGKSHNSRYLHFPMEGYTLALDIKIDSKIWTILDQLDEIVTALNGRIYLTKDARLSMQHYLTQYPNQLAKNNKFISYQMERLQTAYSQVFLILGANSDIAKAILLEWIKAYPNAFFILASKNTEALKIWVSEQGLEANSTIHAFDAADIASHPLLVASLPYQPHTILYAAGLLVDNEEVFQNPQVLLEANMVNYMGAVSIINELVKSNDGGLKKIIGLSSIAALRGRKSNFIYGSSKAGFHAYLFGLRQELKSKGILVQAVTPGFVTTKMTAHLTQPNNAVAPATIAKKLLGNHQGFELYPNFYWKIIGNLVKILPEFIIAKL